jgi:hypothetical protein
MEILRQNRYCESSPRAQIGMRTRLAWISLLLCSSIVAVSSGEMAESREKLWKAGLAAVDISPREPIWLAGYAVRTKPSEGSIHPIYAKALALEDPKGKRLVIITSDLLGFTRALAEPIAKRLKSRFGLKREEALFTSSHTHTAPVVREYSVFAYGLTPEQEAAVDRYSRQLEDSVVELVGAALKDMAPSRLSLGRGTATFGANRRVASPRGFVIDVNKEGPVDHEVPLLRIEGEPGNLRGMLFSYACHNTTLTGEFYQVSGDYAGFAQSSLEKAHPGARALFAMGCGGDINPQPRSELRHAEQHGKDLAAAVDKIMQGPMQAIEAKLKTVFDYTMLPFAPLPTREELEARLQDKDRYRQRNAQRMLDILKREGRLPASYPYPVQVAQFGRSLTLVALGGEVVVDYSLRLKRELNATPLFLLAYSNDVMGYIPSLRVLKEGGYEGGGSMIFYGQPGPWGEQVENLVVGKVHELVRRAQR